MPASFRGRLAGPAAWALLAPAVVFLALAAFAYPATDDWVTIQVARQQGVAAGAAAYLAGWGGRYLAAPASLLAMAAPDPVALFPILIAAALAAAVAALRLWLPAGLPHPWRWAAALAGLAGATLPSRAEGLYWLSGVANYLLPAILAIALVGLLLRHPGRRWLPPALVAGGLLAAGGGETVAILAAVSAVALRLLGRRAATWLLAGLLLGGALALALPGSWARLHAAGGGGDPAAALAATGRQVIALVGALVVGPVPAAWLLAALLGAAAGGPRPSLRLPLAAAAAGLGGAYLALLPSLLALGMAEGRQADAVWIALLLWSLALAWWAGARWPQRIAGPGAVPRLAVVAVLAAVAAAPPPAVGAAALWTWCAALPLLAAAAWALARAADARRGAALLALAIWLSAPMALAVRDLAARAPFRRGEQASRDAAVARLVAAGHRRIRVPLPDPRLHPGTLSVGDLLGAGTWWNRAYAAVHGAESVMADPRCAVPEPAP